MRRIGQFLKLCGVCLLWAFSIATCIATIYLWPRSYGNYDDISYRWAVPAGTYDFDIRHNSGLVSSLLQLNTNERPVGWLWSTQPWTAPKAAIGGGTWGFRFRKGSSPYTYGTAFPYWFVLAIGLSWPTLSLTILCWRLRRRRRMRGCCSQCSYDLRAHKIGDKCPECGTIIADPHSESGLVRLRRRLADTAVTFSWVALLAGLGIASLYPAILIHKGEMAIALPFPGVESRLMANFAGLGWSFDGQIAGTIVLPESASGAAVTRRTEVTTWGGDPERHKWLGFCYENGDSGTVETRQGIRFEQTRYRRVLYLPYYLSLIFLVPTALRLTIKFVHHKKGTHSYDSAKK